MAVLPSGTTPELKVGCAAGCGAKVLDEDAALAAAWTYLEITRRYRCPECTHELAVVNAPEPPQ